MDNFEFKCPTKIIFGADTICKIKNEIPHDRKILIKKYNKSAKTI